MFDTLVMNEVVFWCWSALAMSFGIALGALAKKHARQRGHNFDKRSTT